MLIFLNLAIIAIASVVIMYACNSFEDGSRRIGRHFPPGIRGATINAIGSSLPELFTTLFLLFLYHDEDGYSGGIATCAGSAVFNVIIIPALCILAISFASVMVRSKKQKVHYVTVQKNTIIRDGFFLILSEIMLIIFLSQTVAFWWMGAILVAFYGVYVAYLAKQIKRHRVVNNGSNGERNKNGSEKEHGLFHNILTLNFKSLLFKGQEITNGKAWILLILGVIFIAIPCHFLAKACVDIAGLWEVPTFFTCVILAAAATSVPDTVLSIKDALKGDYDDAIANAFGSNIFDIGVCLGFPLLLYGLIYGDVHLSGSPTGTASVQELQILLLIITFAALGIFLAGRKIGAAKATLFLLIYSIFMIYVVGRAFQWQCLDKIVDTLQMVFPSFS